LNVRLVGYVRVSRVGGRDPELETSAPEQRKRIKSYANAQGHSIARWIEDLDQPGSKYERPGLQEALALVESRKADGLIVGSLDRFARSVPDAALALRRLETVGGTLISVKDALDTSTPVGKFARTMMLALAELELDRIRENWQTIRDRAIGRGVHFSTYVPTGYVRGSDGRLEPDKRAAPVVTELFQRRAAGQSWETLAAFLDDRIPKESGHTWTRQTVSSIIRNRAYLGEARAGDARNPDAHESLIDRATWERAQPDSRTWTPRGKAMLTGVLCCASCGRPMTSASQDQRGYFNYRCRGRSGVGVCPAPARISARKVETYVEGAFIERLAQAPLRAAASPVQVSAEDARARVRAAELELATYRDANLISVIGRDAYSDGLRVRVQALRDADAELRAAEAGGGIAAGTYDVATDLWPTFTPDEKRRVLATCFERIEVARAGRPGQGTRVEDRVRLVWRDLPGQ
jgi:DNA invertase Pin-like site-specific DNA recombinase